MNNQPPSSTLVTLPDLLSTLNTKTEINSLTRTAIFKAENEVVIETIPPHVTDKRREEWVLNWALELSESAELPAHGSQDF